MKLPLSWLSEYVSLPKSITLEQIVGAFVRIGFEVEGVENPGKAIKGPLRIGKVLSIEELTGLKKPIRYVGLDCGEKSVRFVICGATNFQVGDLVVVAIPGSVLPGNFAITARETYGRTSNGMICSARELGLGDDHNGIIVVRDSKARVGDDALKTLKVDDPVIDIAVNPDRGYAMSIRGAARELAMALGRPFIDIDGKKLLASLEKKKKSGKFVRAQISDKSGADSIFLRSLIEVDASAITPDWMARRLTQAGMRPISLAVDITNYVMLELGQPLHAFDSEKIKGTLRVQRAGKFTNLTTLDNQKRKLNKEDLLIADDVKPLALAGTMGGADSEVSANTNRISLEAAHFNSVAISQNSRRHLLSSEASRRFERGVDPNLAPLASARAALLLIELAGAKYVGTSKVTTAIKSSSLSFEPQAICDLLGAKYSVAEIKTALIAVGCTVRSSGKKMIATAPSWRRDLIHVADLAEEVARFFGYERIPSILPSVKSSTVGAIGLTPLQLRRRGISIALANRGFTEVHNYPFVSAEQMALFGFTGDRAKTFEIANPMSEEFPFLRTHMTPGLLNAAARNLARGASSVALFESGLVFRNTEKLLAAGEIPTARRPSAAQIKKIYESVPKQALHIAGVIAGEFENSGWWGKARKSDWSDAVDIASELLEELVTDFEVVNAELAPWHPGRCAEFRINGKAVAHAGEIHPRIISALQLPERTSVFALVLDAIPFSPATAAKPVITMPAAIQDISLLVDEKITAGEVKKALTEGAGPLLESIELFDRFQKPGEKKISLAFTLTFRAADRTLTSDEVSAAREQAGAMATKRCGATIRS